MKTYHKIQTVFMRDPETKFKTLLEGQYALPEFAYLAQNQWVFTEKVDGMNIRVIFDGESLSFAGKTDRADIPPILSTALQTRFEPRVEQFREMFPDGACLYGEGYGARIQKAGKLYRPDQDFVLFDVKIGEWWLQRPDVDDIAQKLALDIVPIIGQGTLIEMVEKTRQGFNSLWGDFVAEGIIARPATELKTRNGHRIITKIKHSDFR